MKKEEFYFDSRSGTDRIHAVRYSPDDGGVKCVVQLVHGMAEYVERYEAFAEVLTKQGFLVVGEDHLGHGKTVTEGGTYGYFCEQDPATVVVRDVHRLKKMTQSLYPEVPYIIMGHSMGSYILRSYMCRYGSGIDGAIIMGTGMHAAGLVKLGKLVASMQKLFAGSRHVSKFIDKVLFGSHNKRISNPQTSVDWLTKDAECVKRYIADPLCGFAFTVNGFATIFELTFRIGKKENLEKIPKDLPVYMLSGTDDPVGQYGEAVRKVYDSLKAVELTNLRLKMYPGDRHELLNETDKEVVMQDICDWINSVIGAMNHGK